MRRGDGARTLAGIRPDLAGRLRLRRGEIEEVIVARLCGMSDPVDPNDAEYARSLRAAIAATTEDALLSIERGEDWSGCWPSATAAHARWVANRGVRLETSLRRGGAAEGVRQEFLVDEAVGLPPRALREILRTRGLHFDRHVASFADEFRHETARVGGSLDQQRGELVRRLLDGRPAQPKELGYEFDAWHVGIVATGPDAGNAARRMRACGSFQFLSVLCDKETAWAWLGGERPLSVTEIQRGCPLPELGRISLAVGEPGHGIDGWRLTHRQARAAHWVALHRPGKLIRYADELLIVAALKDDVLASSLREIYLSPLNGHANGASPAYATLRAYFNAGCNAATAAAALQVDRHTVGRRLQRIEERLDRRVHTCRAELEVALRLEELGQARTDPAA